MSLLICWKNPEIGKALYEIRESAFSNAELAAYDKFWDIISVEITLYNSWIRRGMVKGMAKGLAKGRAKGLAEGIAKGRSEGLAEGRAEGEKLKQEAIARGMKADGLSIEMIVRYTGLSAEDIENL